MGVQLGPDDGNPGKQFQKGLQKLQGSSSFFGVNWNVRVSVSAFLHSDPSVCVNILELQSKSLQRARWEPAAINLLFKSCFLHLLAVDSGQMITNVRLPLHASVSLSVS